MIKHYSFFAKWRKRDIEFLNSFDLGREIEEGYFGFSVEEGEMHDRILAHFSKEDSLFKKTRPPEYSHIFGTVTFSNEELESAQSYTTYLGRGKLEIYWDDSAQWKKELYDGMCGQCGQPIGKQQRPWVLKRDFKNMEKYPFVGFEGLGGFVFCGKELASLIQKEFGIGHLEVLIGKKRRVSEHLVQLDIPLAPYKLNVDGNEYGRPYEDNEKVYCPECGQRTFTNQTLDFFPPFEKEFDYDLVLSQEWFGWYRRFIFSRRFLDFCFEHKILKKWPPANVIIPQKNSF